jgi:BioD-like phosphotransacetylase family protein
MVKQNVCRLYYSHVGSACDNDALSELVGFCAHSVASALSALRSCSNQAKAASVFTALRPADIIR